MLEVFISLIIALVVVAVIYYGVKTILPALGLPLPPATMAIVNVILMVITLVVLLKYVPPLLDSL